jgi:hypothetical protein
LSRSTELTDKLLDRIYDAATEQDLWRSVLTEIADLTNSQGGILYGLSIAASTVYFEYNGRLSEECNRVHQERYLQNIQEHPWAKFMERQPVGQLVQSDEIVPLPSLRRTPFFDDVLHPQDVAHNAMIALAAKDDFRAAFNICRSARQGPFDEEERTFFERLVPHLCRSIRLGFRIDGYRALQHAAFDVLDRLSVGVILLDRRARIVYVNAPARSFGSDGGALHLRNSIVSTWSPAHSQRLGELIRTALSGAPTGSMSVPRPSDGQLLTILVSSVRGRDIGRFGDLGMRDAAALLFIVDPSTAPGSRCPGSWMVTG